MFKSIPKFLSLRLLIKRYWKDFVFTFIIIVGVTTWMQRNMLDANSSATNFKLTTLTGETQDLLHSPQKTLIYFFAPWCVVCKFSMSNLSSVSDRIRTVAVALDYQHQNEVGEFVDDIEVAVPVLLGNAEVAASYKVSAYPSYYVIDNNGKILDRSMGYSSLAGLLWRTR